MARGPNAARIAVNSTETSYFHFSNSVLSSCLFNGPKYILEQSEDKKNATPDLYHAFLTEDPGMV